MIAKLLVRFLQTIKPVDIRNCNQLLRLYIHDLKIWISWIISKTSC